MKRFLKLKHPVQTALIDLKSPINLSDNKFKVISQIISVLLSMKLGVEALCLRDAKLLAINATINFWFNSLIKQKLDTFKRIV